MMSRALYHVALGLAVSALSVQVHADGVPVVLGARQMDGVTTGAAALVDRYEAADHWHPITSIFGNGDASFGATSSETAGETFGPSTGAAVSAGDSGTGGGISLSVTSSGLGAMGTSSASAFTSSETAGETFGPSTGAAVSAGDSGTGGGISLSVTSSGLGAMGTSSASAFGAGPSSVLVSSATAFAPDGMAMSAFSSSSSIARSSSFAAR